MSHLVRMAEHPRVEFLSKRCAFLLKGGGWGGVNTSNWKTWHILKANSLSASCGCIPVIIVVIITTCLCPQENLFYVY